MVESGFRNCASETLMWSLPSQAHHLRFSVHLYVVSTDANRICSGWSFFLRLTQLSRISVCAQADQSVLSDPSPLSLPAAGDDVGSLTTSPVSRSNFIVVKAGQILLAPHSPKKAHMCPISIPSPNKYVMNTTGTQASRKQWFQPTGRRGIDTCMKRSVWSHAFLLALMSQEVAHKRQNTVKMCIRNEGCCGHGRCVTHSGRQPNCCLFNNLMTTVSIGV